jgi:peptidoglycan/xylan/chitin deacetylase (PgdA/CDA1 family)
MSDVLVLCYHAVSERWPAALSVRPSALAAQLRLVRRAGYVGTTFTRAVQDPPAPRTVAVTFDDAYRSELTLAAPVLRELGWPATIFAPSDHVGHGPMSWPGIEQWVGGPHEAELTPLGWDELGGLAEEGWEIGSHTCSHPRLTQVDDEALDEELRRSRATIEERLGRPCTSLAYPYGDLDDRVAAAAGAAGYEAAATLAGGPDAPLRFPRVGVWHGDALWRFAIKAAPPVRRVQARR